MRSCFLRKNGRRWPSLAAIFRKKQHTPLSHYNAKYQITRHSRIVHTWLTTIWLDTRVIASQIDLALDIELAMPKAWRRSAMTVIRRDRIYLSGESGAFWRMLENIQVAIEGAMLTRTAVIDAGNDMVRLLWILLGLRGGPFDIQGGALYFIGSQIFFLCSFESQIIFLG